MVFTEGREYICQGISSEPIRIRILQRVYSIPDLYKITSTNLFNSDFVQESTPFMIFTYSGAYDGRTGENDILGRWARGEESIRSTFCRRACLGFCEHIGTRSNWQEVEESAQSALEQCEAPTRPNSPRRRSFTLNTNIRF
tara:strand:- start:489 stop:911 length:423 start_codon:yes stop_codon:yes gene_type:complete